MNTSKQSDWGVRPAPQENLESPFLSETLFAGEAADEWEARLGTLEAESPFLQRFEIAFSNEEDVDSELADSFEMEYQHEVKKPCKCSHELESATDEELAEGDEYETEYFDQFENEEIIDEQEILAFDGEDQDGEAQIERSEFWNKSNEFDVDEVDPTEFMRVEEDDKLSPSSSLLFENEKDILSMKYVGPKIGPIHTGVVPATSELRVDVPKGAILSPLAITLRGLRDAPNKMSKVSQIVIHNTGRGPVTRSKDGKYRKSAIDYALSYYLNGDGGFPHYVIDFNGTIYATCDERYQAHHAGWRHSGGRSLFESKDWKSPEWWTKVWGKYGFNSPIDLLPKDANSPNSESIGIELLISPDLSFAEQQYSALAQLVIDIEQRYQLVIPSIPNQILLGHEDYAPVSGDGGRATSKGGWDPGAHRSDPYFSWDKLWFYILWNKLKPAARSIFTLPAPFRQLFSGEISLNSSAQTGFIEKEDSPRKAINWVRFAQRVLNAVEGEQLKVDGLWGKDTRVALKRFHEKYKIEFSGALNNKTRIALLQRALETINQRSESWEYGVLDETTKQVLTNFKFEQRMSADATIDIATLIKIGEELLKLWDPRLVLKYVVTSPTLNFRRGPDLKEDIQKSLGRGEIIDRLGVSDDGAWYQVRHGGQDGWSFAKSLEPIVSISPLFPLIEIASTSTIASCKWTGQGIAPLGYIIGMALVYARVYCKLKAGDAGAKEMAKANTGNRAKDALAYYAKQFGSYKMENNVAGVDTLRHLFVLLIGLGMRESSGNHCKGRDLTADNKSSEKAEAGLFQTSYDARHAHPLMNQLFLQYLANPSGYIEIFRVGAGCSKEDSTNWGDGEGKEFQRLSKECPAFAAEFTAIGLRNTRQHWGPINTKIAEISPKCDEMLKRVQEAVDKYSLCQYLQV